MATTRSRNRTAEVEALTSPTVYLRFPGRGGLYSSRYSNKELTDYARKITGWLSEGKKIRAFFNNDIDAHAIHNALELHALIKSMT